MRQKWNSFMIFGASFVVSLSLMLIVVMLVLSFSIPTKSPPKEEHAVDISLEGFVPTEEDRRNVLFLCCQKQSEDPFGYCLVSFSPKEDTLWLIDLPADEILGEDGSLNDAYRLGSSEYAKNAAEELLDIEVDGYLRIAAEGGISLINAFGKVPVIFHRETAAGGYLFPAGEHRLNGKELWSLMGEGDIACYAKPMVEQVLFSDRYDEADDFFHAITGSADTDVLIKDYYDSKKALRYFWYSEGKKVEAISLPDPENREEWFATVLAALGE